MSKETVYLAGPMTGIPEFNFPAFFKTAEELADAGYTVINPAAHDKYSTGFDPTGLDGTETAAQTGFSVEEALNWDLQQIANYVDAVVVLPGWEESTGTQLEIALAMTLALSVVSLYSALNHHGYSIEVFADSEFRLWSETEVAAKYFVRAEGWRRSDNGVLFLKESFAQVKIPTAITEVLTTSSTGGQKGVKPARFDLLPWEALTKVAEHYGKGAEKYSDHNWRKGYEWSKSYAALMRHLTAFWNGEDYDPETGSHHLTAVIFHALALLTYTEEHQEFDDRYKGEK